ncbi:MAG: NAD(P)/FAD-dependent oxidoreductase [Anaerolineae bacterium]|nr:NAD(P)/FAD-dependent oxidoreductase [Anaerolineae bacterium]
MKKSIIMIGAGVAGLSAGCYGQMNGYDTQIFELHSQPGGLCTSWKRQGYVFDGCIHWLVGSKTGSSMNRIWQELGAAQGRQMVNHEEFTRFQSADGKAFILYTNVDRLEQHLKDLAPADEKAIRELCGQIRKFAKMGEGMMGEPAGGLLGKIKRALATASLMPAMIKYGKMSIQTFAERFSDPFLRKALSGVFDISSSSSFPAIALLMTMAWQHNQDAGYPIGGSLAFARAIERRYLDLGGQIHYRSRVDKILVEACPEPGRGARAVGVRLTDGSEHRADVVISAADGHATIFDMLEGKYADDKIRGYYRDLPIFAPIVQVSLGINRDLSGQPHSVQYELPEALQIAGEARRTIGFKHYGYDPTIAPAGKSVVTTMFPSSHAYWKELAEEPERYDAEKKDIAIKVIDQLERRYPGVSEQVEAVDVATPLTFERYTGNWQGSMEGWLLTTETMMMTVKGMDKTLPGLEDFYMVGQWVEPGGGLPPAATSGRGVIETICKKDDRPFVATTP